MTAQSPPRFTPTISLGNILAVATALFSLACSLAGFAYGYGVLSSQQAEITRRIDQIENSQRDRENRTRLLEANSAAQASDLRNIQKGIEEIKVILARMQEGR